MSKAKEAEEVSTSDVQVVPLDTEYGPEVLREVMELRNFEMIEGVSSAADVSVLADLLKTDLHNGLDEEDDSFARRRERFGANVYPEPVTETWWELFVAALKDITLIILAVIALVQLIIWVVVYTSSSENKVESERCELGGDAHGENGYVEAVAILGTVLVVGVVTATQDWKSNNQFQSLNKIKDDRKIKVTRAGEQKVVSIYDINVGDIVSLDTGDHVPADGVFIDGHDIECDESVMTGETDNVKKNANRPFFLSGTRVVNGVGRMIVICVGDYSEWGQVLVTMLEGGGDDEDEDLNKTPLQLKLEKMADLIGKGGFLIAAFTFMIQLVMWLAVDVGSGKEYDATQVISKLLGFVIVMVTIVVVAVPEGLPLAVTISLAYSQRKMLEDQNLVRRLAACETMGGATNICSDKTGTLTENRMTVVQGWFFNQRFKDQNELLGLADNMKKSATTEEHNKIDLVARGIAVNSKAFITFDEHGKPEFVGNKTEGALLLLLNRLDVVLSEEERFKSVDYHAIREENEVLRMCAFSSERKRMSVFVPGYSVGGGADKSFVRCFTKGASEIILERCEKYVSKDGSVVDIDDSVRSELEDAIVQMATSGLRTICLAYRDIDASATEDWEDSEDPEVNLTCIGIVGIKDPVRLDVPEAVMSCQKAGITVRMVTGDNKLTASHIARECGILTDDGLVMEGPEFRKLSPAEMDDLVPRLQVLARSSPKDKYTLVHYLRVQGEVVAVTGDGTNDAPALNEADIGCAMGIAGTEVAKEASDMVIMDDNFRSIVQAVKWGRNVYDNVRKFLQFQLTVNVVAVAITFIAACSNKDPPLNAVQLLWVNLIMDTLGALALATEVPSESVLEKPPYGRDDMLVNYTMWRNILGQSLYQLIVLLVLLYSGPSILELDTTVSEATGITCTIAQENHVKINTVIFNAFVWCQLFNEINSRRIYEVNVFENFFNNAIFLGVLGICALIQVLMIEVFGVVTSTVPLDPIQWLVSILIGLMSLPVGAIIHLVPLNEEWVAEKLGKVEKKVEVAHASVETDGAAFEEWIEGGGLSEWRSSRAARIADAAESSGIELGAVASEETATA